MRVEITEICTCDAFHSGLLFEDSGTKLVKAIPVVGTRGGFVVESSIAEKCKGFLTGWFTPEETSPLAPHTKSIFFAAIKVKEITDES